MIDQIHAMDRFPRNPREAKPLFEFVKSGLAACDCSVIWHSPLDESPVQITLTMPNDERVGILVYAFPVVRSIRQQRRSSHFDNVFRLHGDPGQPLEVFTDRTGLLTTLLIGIDVERDFLVGMDGVFNTPSPFVDRVAFREPEVRAIQEGGWHQWEREQDADCDDPVEILVGAMRPRFLDYVLFERTAAGLDAGPRHLLAEKSGALRQGVSGRRASLSQQHRISTAR